MKNKTIKNIAITSVALIGIGYVLKSIKSTRIQPKIEGVENFNIKNNNSLQSYVLTGEMYYELRKNPSLISR